MDMTAREEWGQDEFLEFWIPTKRGELEFIGIVVCTSCYLFVLVLRRLTFKIGGFGHRCSHDMPGSTENRDFALADSWILVLRIDL